MFDDVERRVRAVRRHNADHAAVDRVVRQFVQHALRHAEHADAVLDEPPRRQHRLHPLPASDLPRGHHRRRPQVPLD